MQHLIIIIDNNKKVSPKKYTCPLKDKTKEEAIKASKAQYEKSTNNFQYESYYFEN